MALVDVSDLLLDPDFVDPMGIIHRIPTLNSYGEQSLQETLVSTIGVSQPTSGKELQRLPEALRIRDVRTFWVKGQIVSDATSAYPDILVFQSERFEVQEILDWTNFLPGWCQCLAVREEVAL